jgi:holdfast attachment protein HfaA
MTRSKNVILFALLATVAGRQAEAGDWTNSSNYNGYGAASQNTGSNFNLRDANGNLTLVDGQFTSANVSQNSGVQTSTSGGVGMSGATSGATSSATSSAGAVYGTATAIGNSLNVVTVGNNNTVIVNSTQTNTGNQTASATVSGH